MGQLTCVAFRTVTAASGVPEPASPASAVFGDSLGSVWMLRRSVAADSFSIVRTVPTWNMPASTSSTTTPQPFASVVWQGDIIIGGAANGDICAWGVYQGVCACQIPYPPGHHRYCDDHHQHNHQSTNGVPSP